VVNSNRFICGLFHSAQVRAEQGRTTQAGLGRDA
jgi:hypothetical protein